MAIYKKCRTLYGYTQEVQSSVWLYTRSAELCMAIYEMCEVIMAVRSTTEQSLCSKQAIAAERDWHTAACCQVREKAVAERSQRSVTVSVACNFGQTDVYVQATHHWKLDSQMGCSHVSNRNTLQSLPVTRIASAPHATAVTEHECWANLAVPAGVVPSSKLKMCKDPSAWPDSTALPSRLAVMHVV